MKRLMACTMLTLLFAGCGIPEQQYNAKLQEIDQLKGELASARDSENLLQKEIDAMKLENRALAKRLQELGGNVEALLGERSRLSSDLKQTQERESRLLAEQEAQRKRMEKYRAVIEKFQSLVSSGKLKIRIVRGQMVVEMASNILFPSGKADLHEEGQEALHELAQVLKTIPDRNFQVAGHTDNVPIRSRKFRSNWALSTARAVQVVTFLQEGGVQPTALSAAGYGEFMPAASNDTEDGRAANRRIEIVLVPNLDELPDMSQLEGEIEESGK